MPHRRFLSALVALALACLGCSSAYAGQYTLTYDFAGDLSGWSGYVEPGYVLCGRGATAGCPDVSTNRILAQPGVGQAVWSQGRWEWTAPPGTQIVGGSLAYRTRMRHSQFYARVKMRADGVTWDAAPTIVNEQQTTALTDHVIPLAGGFRQVGVALYAHPAAAGLVTRPVGRLRDARADGRDRAGRHAARAHLGRRRRLARRGVASRRRLRDVRARRPRVGRRRRLAGQRRSVRGLECDAQRLAVPAGRRLCPAHALPGSGGARRRHPCGCRRGLDASGEQAAQMPFTVRIDATPPSARLLAPGAVASDARPGVELEVGDAASGISSVLAQIDGVTRAAGSRRSARERAAGLAVGLRRAHARMVDRRRGGQPDRRECSLRCARHRARRRSAPRSRRTAHRSPPARC